MENVNIPKFIVDDIPVFKSITSDIFPNVKKDGDETSFKFTLDEVCLENNLISKPVVF